MTEKQLPAIGQQVLVRGEVRLFEKAANPGGFDAKAYYRGQGIAFSLRHVEVCEVSGRPGVREWLYRLRQRLDGLLERYLPPKEASVMGAVLLGDKKGMDGEVKSLYQKGGIAHVLAISGLHISFFGMAVYRLLKKLGAGKGLSAWSAGLFLGAYVAMVGPSPSSLRALYMFWLYLAAALLGRTYDALTALFAAAAVIVTANPYALWDAGFQLSFAALLGIWLLVPGMQLPGKKRRIKLLNALLSGAAVSAATLPVVLWYFYEYPIYALFLNLIVIPGMGLLLPLGLLILAFGAWWPGAASLAAWPVRGILWLYELLCRGCQKLDFLRLSCGRPAPWKIAAYYGCLLLLALWLWYCLDRQREEERKIRPQVTCGRAAACLALLVCLLGLRGPAAFSITMLDVGQGDCFVLQRSAALPSFRRSCFLIDGGSTSQSSAGTKVILPYLKYQGISGVEAVFLSHMDADHYNGILELLEEAARGEIRIKRLYLPPEEASLEDTAQKRQELAKAAKKAGAACLTLRAGEKLQDGGLSLSCLYPDETVRSPDNNGASQVLLCRYGTFSALFTGDLGIEEEETLLKETALGRCQVLKVAHHGSASSTGSAFLERVRPELALISCARYNNYGHPAPDTISRLKEAGARTCISYETGAVTIVPKGKKILVYTY